MKRRTPTPATPHTDALARLADAQTLLALVASRPSGPMPDLDVDRAIAHLRGVLALDVLLRAGRPTPTHASTCPACEAPDGDHALHCPRATEAP